MLHLEDRWIWDFWLVEDGPDRHAFYLQAPRSLGDADLRHDHATVGHAVSGDLRTWEVLPNAFGAGPPGSWDDLTIWTGSVIRHRAGWAFAYTGRCRAEHGLVQRIGIAVSEDLLTWRRLSDQPTLLPDPQWYDEPGSGTWPDQAWRDPWLLDDPDGDGVLAFVTCRVRSGPLDGRSAIGVARSDDLLSWRVEPPAYAPGEFGEIEVPQVVRLGGAWRLVFSVPENAHGRAWTERSELPPRSRSYCVTSSGGPTGPYPGAARPLLGDDGDELFAAKVGRDAAGDWIVLAARFRSPRGDFVGALSDPLRLRVAANGALSAG